MPLFNITWDEKPKPVQKIYYPIITFSKGSIRMNNLAANLVRGTQKVMLGYDEKMRVIALKAHDGSEEIRPYPVKVTQRPEGITIYCKQFIEARQAEGIIPVELPFKTSTIDWIYEIKTLYIHMKEHDPSAE